MEHQEVPMKNVLKVGLAATLAAGSMIATAAPAAAAPWGGWHGGYGYRGYGPGAVIAGGLAGLAVGAALAGPHYVYGPGPYYGPAYYGPGVCVAHRTVWDPYFGHYVVRSFRYAC